MAFCSNCGTQLNDTAIFCAVCRTTRSAEREQPQQSTHGVPLASVKKKSKAPFVITGIAGFIIIAVAAVLIYTNAFGLFNKLDGDIIKTTITVDGMKQEITSIKLQDKKTITLDVGELCHYREDEKLSIPYRWVYYISDENVIGVFYDDYKYDNSRSKPGNGGDEGWRTVYFKALAPGKCVITVRYEDVRDPEQYSDERKYTIEVVSGNNPANSNNPNISNSSTAQPPESSETPSLNTNAKLVGTWEYLFSPHYHATVNGDTTMGYVPIIYTFNENGTFEYIRHTPWGAKFTGKYSISDGKIYFTEMTGIEFNSKGETREMDVSKRTFLEIALDYEYSNDGDGEYLKIGTLHQDTKDKNYQTVYNYNKVNK